MNGKSTGYWIWIVLVFAGMKCALGIAGSVAALAGAASFEPGLRSPAISVALFLIYALAGCLLLAAGRRDFRAVHLGCVFLLIASSSSARLYFGFAFMQLRVLSEIAKILTGIEIDSYLPLFLWLFFDDFPRVECFGFLRKISRVGIGVSAFTGSVHLLALMALVSPFAAEQTRLSSRYIRIQLYAWVGLAALAIPAIALPILKIKYAPLEERRRVRLFLAGLVVGFLPYLIAVLLVALSSSIARLIASQPTGVIIISILRLFLISVPITTTYSVLVDHVLDVRLYIRRGIQYLLTRYALIAATMLPFIMLLLHLYRHRDQTVINLFFGSPLVLCGATIIGILAIRIRHRVLQIVDRRYFREQYDAHQILANVAGASRSARTVAELTSLLVKEIDRALHLESVPVLLIDYAGQRLKCLGNVVRPLETSFALAKLLAASPEPLVVDLESPESMLLRLNRDEREWLADGGFSLLVPILGSDGSLMGLVALREKKSELPFSKEDRLLLMAIAASTALTLGKFLLSTPDHQIETGDMGIGAHRWLSPASDPNSVAVECMQCHLLQPGSANTCRRCGGQTSHAVVPYVLLGKFRFEKRIGAGAMGVVYQATDLALGRKVAIKTLSRVSPELARRLRREARAVAAVSHPNLACIFGAEIWQGTPMLVFEFLEGGTLAARIRTAHLYWKDVLDLGIILCGVLDCLHSAGILHRDIKPSNIGYAADGTPKLLDLGLAKILPHSFDSSALELIVQENRPDLSTLSLRRIEDDSNINHPHIVGTLAYMSPEALQGQQPDPKFDLWSLAVVLFEALTAVNPFGAATMRDTFERIQQAQIADIRHFIPECAGAMASLFDGLLARDPGRRPTTAMTMKARLEDIRDRLAA